jgi:aminoglycoside phosphotransferase (APT) family kinase protein
LLEKRLSSDIVVMKQIQGRTSIPIPVIYDFDITADNPLGRPYILMSCVPGRQLDKLWFDPTWYNNDRRQNVFRSLAKCMSQLKDLEFSAIGCLQLDSATQSCVVGPLLPSHDSLGSQTRRSTASGPHSSVHTYLLSEIVTQMESAETTDHRASLILLRMFAASLPNHTLDGPPFVLSMPDFNYQNVFVDDEGFVTGLIDWDDAKVGPREGGYARYPSWITRDWDPLLYSYEYPVDEDEESSSLREKQQEDSPTTLQQLRDEYLEIYAEVDPEGARLTRHSHIFEALENAISAPYLRGHILDKLARYAFGPQADSAGELCSYGLEQGVAVGDWLRGFPIGSNGQAHLSPFAV